mmetsp:Transcript_27010/g.54593  ORF Transcript_27010/g.54593 Transcript_27010/m.54593 type:complete len:187 (+) Transcript_27010:66-626(+)
MIVSSSSFSSFSQQQSPSSPSPSSSSQATARDINFASTSDRSVQASLSWNHHRQQAVAKTSQRGDSGIISNLERLYVPSLDDAKRDDPPRCISLESHGTSHTADDDGDSIMVDGDACKPLDYRLDWSKDMELSVSECLSSNPSLLGLSPDEVAKTPEVATENAACDQPKTSKRAAWDTLSISNWHI